MIESKDISVIVQGAIDKKLTFKCLKNIRKFLPDAQIILSTWENYDVSGLDYDALVLNKDPKGYKHDFYFEHEKKSINNFNRQLVSTVGALDEIKRKYSLKLRSDLILNNVGFLKFWDKFDYRKDEFKIFKHRVIAGSIYSREYSDKTGTGLPTPFHPSDFWFFGLSEDIKDYFINCPLQTKKQACDWNFKYPNRLPYIYALWQYAPEQVLCVNWVKKYYPDLVFDDWSDWNIENIEFSNNILYNNFIFLDYKQSGVFSKKHSSSIKNLNDIDGLITYNVFRARYKKYCDNSYDFSYSEKNHAKFHSHYKKLVKPFCCIIKWFGELFSVIYYFFKCFLEEKNDR